jgi:hypothetical protein
MSKGSNRRLMNVGLTEFDDNWESAFPRSVKNRKSMKNRRKEKPDEYNRTDKTKM